MPEQDRNARLQELALQWAKAQEDVVLRHGLPLGSRQLEDAVLVGVRAPSRVRILVVDRIPMPDSEELAHAARQAHIITEASRATTFGYGIVVRGDAWHDRELILHQLVHVAQCERSGGLDVFVGKYLADRAGGSANFSLGSLEEEARQVARDICSGKNVSSDDRPTADGD